MSIFDTREIEGVVTVCYADGSENYSELGSDQIIHPEVGEVVFSDTKHMVIARRWCWRQSSTSAANEGTINAIITIEAQHESGRADVEQALADCLTRLSEFAGGTFESAVLDVGNPSI